MCDGSGAATIIGAAATAIVAGRGSPTTTTIHGLIGITTIGITITTIGITTMDITTMDITTIGITTITDTTDEPRLNAPDIKPKGSTAHVTSMGRLTT